MVKNAANTNADSFTGLTALEKLQAEIDLLSRCSTDTVYRLRYDTMRYDYISLSATHLLGYTIQELMRINMRALILETRIISNGMRAVESYTGLEETRKRGEVSKWQADYLMKTKDGRTVWVSDISYPWFDNNGAIIGSVGSLRDISERIAAEQKIRKELLNLSNNDTVTGLANRQIFWSRLEEEARRLKRTHGDLTLLLINIDQFQKVVATYGQEIGDSVLKDAARILKSCLRDIDSAARLSEEEFGVILPETAAEGGAVVANRISDAIAERTFFAGSLNNTVGCTASMGIASTRFGQTMDAINLYKLADTRLYIAKHTGENKISADDLIGNLH